MLIRVREVEGGYSVTLLSADGEAGSRVTPDLAEAFAWQAAGALPDKAPAEDKKGRKK